MSVFGKPVDIPVIDVHNDNIKEIWPSLCLAVKSATFIGVDTELSGLGDRKVLNAKSIEDRYRGLTAVAKTRSILSLGLSCFKLIPNPDGTSESKWSYHIQTFNIIVLCSEDYIVEPASLKFLVDHSFDFNKQYSTGVPYYRGADRGKSAVIPPSVRGLFSIIVHQQIPLVIHNGLVDLVFLYHNFYTELPVKLASFIADLSEMFPHGIYDTKYITDFIERMEASYLEYVFIQCQRENQEYLKNSNREVYFKFPTYPDSYTSVGYHRCGYSNKTWLESDIEKIRPNICLCFAAHGWCNKPRVCTLIHDVELTISIGYLLTAKQRRNRKRQRNRKLETKDNGDAKSNDGESHKIEDLLQNKTSADKTNISAARSGCHRAGFDAFMTASILSVFIAKHNSSTAFEKDPTNVKMSDLNLGNFKNKVYLSGKDIPLVITKSAFSKCSTYHKDKIGKLKYCGI
ncbi:hypothetical protein LOTGIDRAFT_111715 [Lottia gigantea]|uniref:Target of EGR1 protein 1 n=1 Tax=Lottia gigantea TaxID=225164 RepID=V4AVA9_LOTGI|nr:hypothetical protein LOTGIDRAFT_111715 [Lottia gigantea]ESP01273.1 hypothetical protein LOTGIDRAFT_111715 [Lottia gigantea]